MQQAAEAVLEQLDKLHQTAHKLVLVVLVSLPQ
jgi:hypothetical protein